MVSVDGMESECFPVVGRDFECLLVLKAQIPDRRVS